MAKTKGSGPPPGSAEWQEQLNEDIAQHDSDARTSGSEGQTFEIAQDGE